MSSGHDHHDNHSSEPKTVAFRTPLILALVTVLIIVLAVSTCDNKQCCEDGTTCEQQSGGHGEHSGQEAETGHEHDAATHDEAAHEVEHATPTDTISVKTDTAAMKSELPAEPAHQ